MIQIGWIVSWTNPKIRKWHVFNDDVRRIRTEAIDAFNGHCKFYFLGRPAIDNKTQYCSLRRRGLAKVVPVFIKEVTP